MAADAPTHWADQIARRVISTRGDKPAYVVASGVAPSGTVTIGHLREVITAELVARALRALGKEVRFIFSWDDFDAFRKVPKNLPQQEMLAAHLRKPLADVPDPYGTHDSYAAHFEGSLEEPLRAVCEVPSYRYQASEHRAGSYAAGIRTALAARGKIVEVLNEHRTEPLPDPWWPIAAFSRVDGTDDTTILRWDGEWTVHFRDMDGEERAVDLRDGPSIKLHWRIDWPMRWAHEQVDFEPAGKDHLTAGGSYDTGVAIAEQVYGSAPPVSLLYGDIGIKGGRGRISSSSGEVVTIEKMLTIYQPEVLRYQFASTRPNAEFVVSFDTDVLKLYEDYDRSERTYFGLEEMGEKKAARERRIYELSQLGDPPSTAPRQVTFRHLCNLLQVRGGDIEQTLASLGASDDTRLRRRARCAWEWVSGHAPEEMRFRLQPVEADPPPLNDAERQAMAQLCEAVGKAEEGTLADDPSKALSAEIYAIAERLGIEPKQLFATTYQVLIGKERGPRLAEFMLLAGVEKLAPLLTRAAAGQA